MPFGRSDCASALCSGGAFVKSRSSSSSTLCAMSSSSIADVIGPGCAPDGLMERGERYVSTLATVSRCVAKIRHLVLASLNHYVGDGCSGRLVVVGPLAR